MPIVGGSRMGDHYSQLPVSPLNYPLSMAEPVERNLGLDLVRVTETAAMAAARWMGRGDKEAADQAAVDGMRAHLATLDIDGVVIIGEGEKDSAPMLYNGERVGTGRGMKVEVAVDPVDGTTLTSKGEPGALSVIAVTEGTGLMYSPGALVYMDKIAVGAEAAGLIDLRNESYIRAVRAAGARIRLIRDGDVAASISTARSDTSIDLLLGIGGSPEAVLSAAALKCMGGEIQCRLWPRDDGEAALAREAGLDRHQVIGTDDLVGSNNVFFAATGVTGGDYLRGVDFSGDAAVTHSVIMRSKTGSIRYMEARHNLVKLREISAVVLD
jgi:fructose-1,6-bisphosphatase II